MNRKKLRTAIFAATALAMVFAACGTSESSTGPRTKNAARKPTTTLPTTTLPTTTTSFQPNCMLTFKYYVLSSCKPIDSYRVVWSDVSDRSLWGTEVVTGGTANGLPGWQDISLYELKPSQSAWFATIDLTFVDGSKSNGSIKIRPKDSGSVALEMVPASTFPDDTSGQLACKLALSGGVLTSCKPITSYRLAWTNSSGDLLGTPQLVTGSVFSTAAGWLSISIRDLTPPTGAKQAVFDLNFADGTQVAYIKVPLAQDATYESSVNVVPKSTVSKGSLGEPLCKLTLTGGLLIACKPITWYDAAMFDAQDSPLPQLSRVFSETANGMPGWTAISFGKLYTGISTIRMDLVFADGSKIADLILPVRAKVPYDVYVPFN